MTDDTTKSNAPIHPVGEPIEASYSRNQVAATAGVSIATLKRWEKQGLLSPIRIGPKLIRYSESNIRALLTKTA